MPGGCPVVAGQLFPRLACGRYLICAADTSLGMGNLVGYAWGNDAAAHETIPSSSVLPFPGDGTPARTGGYAGAAWKSLP